MRLQPVLVPVPDAGRMRTPQQVRQQQSRAREALRECARRCGAPEDGWEKNANDVPQPQAGYYWSVAHKRRWAAAVIADRPVGIDVEQIAPRREALFDALAGSHEWDIIGGRSWPAFFRLWTAKEATLKANGIGIAGFAACRLIELPDEAHMTLEYESRLWRIEHYLLDDHIAAVTCNSDRVHWHTMGNV